MNASGTLGAAAALAFLGASLAVQADTVEARCEVRPAKSATETPRRPCTFSQSQGYVLITLEDGTTYDLTPIEGVGNYRDAEGRPAYRKSGLGDAGLIFSIGGDWVYVYW